MKIKPTMENDLEHGNTNLNKMSKLSLLVKFLLKVRFIPIRINNNEPKVAFKLCSTVTLTFIAIYWGSIFLLVGVNQLIVHQIWDYIMEYMNKKNMIDMVSIMIYNFLFNTLYICPLFLGHAFPSVATIALDKDLKWPRHGTKHILSVVLCAVGSGAANASVFHEIFEGENVPGQSFIPFCIIPIIQVIVMKIYWVVPLLLVSAWMEKLINLCNCKGKENDIMHATRCLRLY